MCMLINFTKRVLFFLGCVFIPQWVGAATCPSVFPAASTANTTQTLTYSYPTGTVFNNFPSGGLLCILFSICNQSITLAAGDHYYNGGKAPGISVTGGPSARLFVNGNLDFKGNKDINNPGNPEDLIIIVKGNLKITSNITINALIYVEGTVTITSNVVVLGAITATGTISPGTQSVLTYDAAAVAAANFSTLCGASAPVFHHFVISVPANGSTCVATSVLITAVDSTGATMAGYTGAISLATSSAHGDWGVVSAVNSVTNGTADDGAASYTFTSADAGDVTLSLLNTHADVTTVSVVDVASSAVTTSSAITFSNNALNISTSNNDIVAGRNHSFLIEYLKRDPVSGSCGVLTNFSGTVNLKFSYQAAASHPAGANAPVVNGVTLPAAQPLSANVNLTFASGTSTFALATSDIGQYQINVLDDSSGIAVGPGGPGGSKLPISGSSPIYSIRPFALYVTVPGNPAASSALGAVFKKAGENFDVRVSGVLYQAADDSNADGLPDGHTDTNPGNNANLADNSVAPSFGREGESVSLSATLILPVAGNNSGLAGTSSVSVFSAGSGTTGVGTHYDEVGIIELSAVISDGVYLSSPGSVYGRSGYVGRFKPAYFSATHITPVLTDGWYDSNADGINDWTCNFTYQGQQFALNANPTVSLTARNSLGVVTQNYSGAFNKLSVSSLTQKNIKFVISDITAQTTTVPGLNNTAALAISDLGGGLIDVTLTGLNDQKNGIFYNKAVQPTSGDEVFSANYSIRFFQDLNNSAPFPVLVVANPGAAVPPFMFANELQTNFDGATFLNTDSNGDGTGDSHQNLVFQDSDSVCYMIDSNADGVPDLCDDYVISGITGTEIRYGRLLIDNAYGSELLPLPMVYRIEYYDHITPTSPTSGFKVNDQDANSVTMCAGSSISSAQITLSDYQLNLAAGETTVGSASVMQNGLGSFILTAPGAGNQGLVKVSVTVPSWLTYDFNGDGVADFPSAVASFGVSAGDDLLFYQRETFR